MSNSNPKRKEPTWDNVIRGMAGFGWGLLEKDEKAIVFEKGNQRIVARHVRDDNWQVEYYSGNAMDDATGINDSQFAKVETMIFGMVK